MEMAANRSIIRVLFALLIVNFTAQATLSEPTGHIEGRAPTAAGRLLIRGPSGDIEDNATVKLSEKPAQFSVSADTTDLTLTDLDNDLGLTAVVDVAIGSLRWTFNGVPFTSQQLNQPFQTDFAGRTLAVVLTASVVTTSVTGAPTSGTQTFTQTYALKVPKPVMLQVNGTSFALGASFPTTGFTGATFTFWMNGIDTEANDSYTWGSDQPWVSVSDGQVTFTGIPTAATRTVTITATPDAGGEAMTYSFSLARWFTHNGLTKSDGSTNDTVCTAQGAQVPGRQGVTNDTGSGATRGTGSLWSEWGAMPHYGSHWSGDYYWAKEIATSGKRYSVGMTYGSLNLSLPSTLYYTLCVIAL
ncbi:hypothetical protein B4916_23385 [Yersinia intermedia]|nr:hypothetical protein B4916_23385 [Yersinia intermedia]